jgi:hypothetical protein
MVLAIFRGKTDGAAVGSSRRYTQTIVPGISGGSLNTLLFFMLDDFFYLVFDPFATETAKNLYGGF